MRSENSGRQATAMKAVFVFRFSGISCAGKTTLTDRVVKLICGAGFESEHKRSKRDRVKIYVDATRKFQVSVTRQD